MTAGLVWRKAWNPGPTMVEIKLHSVMTRHARNPVDTYASTQLTLTRQDATTLAAVLLAAVNDMDAERGKPTT